MHTRDSAPETRVFARTQLPAHALLADVNAIAAQRGRGAGRERLRAGEGQAQHVAQRIQPPARAHPAGSKHHSLVTMAAMEVAPGATQSAALLAA